MGEPPFGRHCRRKRGDVKPRFVVERFNAVFRPREDKTALKRFTTNLVERFSAVFGPREDKTALKRFTTNLRRLLAD